MDVTDKLALQFDPLTIEHLGYKMYSHLPNALAELIANAYDADATQVEIRLSGAANEKSVLVWDDGHGMSVEDLNGKYLRIGRNRRAHGPGRSESGKRLVAGKKGLGKLALFGIGETISLRTKRKGTAEQLHMELDWEELRKSAGSVYHPKLAIEAGIPESSGTSIELKRLRRKTDIDPGGLADSLGRLFNYSDTDFEVRVVSKDGRTFIVDRTTRLAALEKDKQWRIPDDLPPDLRESLPDARLKGTIVAATKPVAAESRGLAIYVRGRMANEPEFYGTSESSFAFSYLSGFLDADYIDEFDNDVISTDRRSVSWDSAVASSLRLFIQRLLLWISRDRRNARHKANRERIRRDHGVDVNDWVGTIRGPEREAVRDAADVLTSPDSAMSDEDQAALFSSLRNIAPDYADLHWRHLHPHIRQVAEQRYRTGLYHSALDEAMKLYLDRLRTAAELNNMSAADIVNHSLADKQLRVDVSGPYAAATLDGTTLSNIREGQHRLSLGSVSAFRNPIAHELEKKLVESGALSHIDCLDGLSLISHLYSRVDRALGSGRDTAPGLVGNRFRDDP